MTERYAESIRPPIPSAGVEVVKAAAIAIAGASGSGKTESAMRVARGYCGPGVPFAVIDTEEKRALYKKSRHQPWDWIDLQPPFTPERYVAALELAKNYKAVIVDSGTHEYAGPGGICEIQEESLEKLAKGDPSKMEKLTAPAWKDAKRRHKGVFMSYLIRYPQLLIICLRAEPKLKFLKEKFQRQDGSEGEKTVIVDAGYQPICEKMFMYEMLASFMMYANNAGVPEQVKALEEDLRPVFLLDQKIDEATGERLAAWASAKPAAPAPRQQAPESVTTGTGSAPSSGETPGVAAAAYITADQVIYIGDKLQESSIDKAHLLRAANVASLELLRVDKYQRALDWITEAAASKRKASK